MNGLLLRPKPFETDSSYVLSLRTPEGEAGTGSYCDARNPGLGLTVIRVDPIDHWTVTRSTDQVALCLVAEADAVGIFGYNISMLCLRSSYSPEGIKSSF